MVRPEHKDRNCTIYFSSKEELEYWRNAAKGSSSSLCGYILEMARRGKESSLTAPLEGAQDLARLREENARLRASESELRQIVRRSETETFKLRFADVEQPGYHELSGPLMELLQAARGPMSGQEILRSLNIDPRDIEAMKALLGQLRTLQAAGLIEEGPLGWKWHEK
jgi:hypothetical protein